MEAEVMTRRRNPDRHGIDNRKAAVGHAVGTDEDGEPITSCVVMEADGDPAAAPSAKKKLPDMARVALDRLRDCLAGEQQPIPASSHVPRGAQGVTLEQWKAYLLKAAVINADGNPREQFRRIRVTLQSRGFIGVWNDFVWVSHAVTSASQ
jgi:hypothetical protein